MRHAVAWVRARGNLVTLVTALVAFLVGRLVIWFGGRIFTAYDTFSYAHRGEPFYDRGPLVSFTGHAPRLWGAPLFYAIFPNDAARAFAQWTVATVAWALLAFALWRFLTHGAARLLALVSVLVLALLPEVANWDFAILSESLSISLGVLTLALLILWVATRSTAALVAATAVSVWWAFVRPEIALMVGFVAAVVALRGWRARHWFAVGSAGVLLLTLGWVSLITPTMSRTFAGWSATHLSLDEETLAFRLRHTVLKDPRIKAAYQQDLGMPDCPAADRVAATRAYNTTAFGAAYSSCLDLKAWGARNAKSSGYRFALTNPGLYVRQTLRVLPQSLDGATLTHVPHVVPNPLARVVFPSQGLVLPLLLGGLLLAFVAALVTRARRSLVLTAAVVAVASATSVLAGLMYSAGTYDRFGIQEAIGLRLSLLILGVAVLDALLGRRPAPAAPTDEPADLVTATAE